MACSMRRLLCQFVVVLGTAGLGAWPVFAQETLVLKADDGLEITADMYASAHDEAAWIVVAHQAGSSRGEYREIAPRLQKLGYNVLSLDQRAGRDFANVPNETAQRAVDAGLSTSYMDALPDIVAGLTYARSQTSASVFIWGSSYSAALALVLAGQQPSLIDGALAFSPGEYLSGQSVAEAAASIEVPIFITSAASETGQWSAIYHAVPGSAKTAFRPQQGGVHGSSSLIPSRNPNAEDYWQAVEAFLSKFSPS